MCVCLQVPKDPDLGVDADRVMKEEQQKIDEAEELSEALIAEKEELLNEVGTLHPPLCHPLVSPRSPALTTDLAIHFYVSHWSLALTISGFCHLSPDPSVIAIFSSSHRRLTFFKCLDFLDLYEGLEFDKVVLKRVEFYCGQLKLL